MSDDREGVNAEIAALLAAKGYVCSWQTTGGNLWAIEVERPTHRNNVMVGPFGYWGDFMDESLVICPEYYDRQTGEEIMDRDEDDYVETTTVDGVVNAVTFYMEKGGAGS